MQHATGAAISMQGSYAGMVALASFPAGTAWSGLTIRRSIGGDRVIGDART